MLELARDPPISSTASLRWQGTDSQLMDMLWKYIKFVYQDRNLCDKLSRNDTMVTMFFEYISKAQHDAAPASIKQAPCSYIFPGMQEAVATPSASPMSITVGGAMAGLMKDVVTTGDGILVMMMMMMMGWCPVATASPESRRR